MARSPVSQRPGTEPSLRRVGRHDSGLGPKYSFWTPLVQNTPCKSIVAGVRTLGGSCSRSGQKVIPLVCACVCVRAYQLGQGPIRYGHDKVTELVRVGACVRACLRACVRVCICVRACVRACLPARACVRACVCAYVRACVRQGAGQGGAAAAAGGCGEELQRGVDSDSEGLAAAP